MNNNIYKYIRKKVRTKGIRSLTDKEKELFFKYGGRNGSFPRS